MRSAGVAAGATAALAALTAATAGAQPDKGRAITGPTTTVKPYVIPVADGVSTISLLTVGDKPAGNGYRMVGIPDGLGALRGEDGNFRLIMNHELRNNQGTVRRHGQQGAFDSSWTIDRRTLAVKSGEDLINPGVTYWNYPAATKSPTASPGGPNPRQPGDVFEVQDNRFARFCSGTLSAPGQFYNRWSRRGYDGQVYFANEENGDPGRVFGITMDGTARQLPRLGLFSWENTKPAFNRTDTVMTIGQEDGATGQQWVYVGTKSKKGDAFDRAGLTNGVGYVADLVDEAVSTDAQFRAKYGKGQPVDFDLAEVDWDQSAAAQNREAATEGLTLNRPEDGAWDPGNPNDYYFLTTEGGKGADVPTGATGRDGGGLWRMSFEDIEHPELGGTLTLLLDGSEEPKLNKPDNMDIDRYGNLLIQEDPGGNNHVARIVAYRISDGATGVVATFDPDRFAPAAPNFMTIDEESSGIIDVQDILGRGWFMFDAQVHKARTGPNAAEEVEEGQMLALNVQSWRAVYGGGRDHDD
jgi:hypothetical protein